jgi:hypothetical protein
LDSFPAFKTGWISAEVYGRFAIRLSILSKENCYPPPFAQGELLTKAAVN